MHSNSKRSNVISSTYSLPKRSSSKTYSQDSLDDITDDSDYTKDSNYTTDDSYDTTDDSYDTTDDSDDTTDDSDAYSKKEAKLASEKSYDKQRYNLLSLEKKKKKAKDWYFELTGKFVPYNLLYVEKNILEYSEMPAKKLSPEQLSLLQEYKLLINVFNKYPKLEDLVREIADLTVPLNRKQLSQLNRNNTNSYINFPSLSRYSINEFK